MVDVVVDGQWVAWANGVLERCAAVSQGEADLAQIRRQNREIAELELRLAAVTAERNALLAACEAGVRYDAAIASCANDPDKMASYCTAQGEDLDALYFDWLNRARAAIAAVKAAQ